MGGVALIVQKKYGVHLSTQEKGRLRQMIRAGRSSAQAITRARILHKTDEGWTASQVAAALDISERTVFRAKRRYAEEGLDEVLRHRNQVNRYRKLDDRGLLAGKVMELKLASSMSHEGVRKRLKKRSQALAEEGMVHSQGERGVRGQHGGLAGPLCQTL